MTEEIETQEEAPAEIEASKKWFIDISSWNKVTYEQWCELVENGCIGAIFKAGQGSFENGAAQAHFEAIKKIGIPYTIYFWVDPTLDIDKQVKMVQYLIEKFGAKSVAIDFEQYWASWIEWKRVKVEHKPGYVTEIPPNALYKKFYEFSDKLRRAVGKDFTMIAYSAAWFIDGYCRPLAAVIRNFYDHYWNAAYVTWAQLDGLPTVTWEEFHKTLDALPSEPKVLPRGIYNWSMWQFQIFAMKGWSKLDVNYIKDDVASAIFGDTVPTPKPEPGPKPTDEPALFQMMVDVDETTVLNIREGQPKVINSPSNDAGDLHKGDIVDVFDIVGSNAWAYIGDNKYVCVQQGSKKFLIPVVTPAEE